jgi:hypothetical protein
MRTARTLEAEWRKVLRGRVGTGAKEDESSTGRIWAVGFHNVRALSHVVQEKLKPLLAPSAESP